MAGKGTGKATVKRTRVEAPAPLPLELASVPSIVPVALAPHSVPSQPTAPLAPLATNTATALMSSAAPSSVVNLQVASPAPSAECAGSELPAVAATAAASAQRAANVHWATVMPVLLQAMEAGKLPTRPVNAVMAKMAQLAKQPSTPQYAVFDDALSKSPYLITMINKLCKAGRHVQNLAAELRVNRDDLQGTAVQFTSLCDHTEVHLKLQTAQLPRNKATVLELLKVSWPVPTDRSSDAAHNFEHAPAAMASATAAPSSSSSSSAPAATPARLRTVVATVREFSTS